MEGTFYNIDEVTLARLDALVMEKYWCNCFYYKPWNIIGMKNKVCGYCSKELSKKKV